MADEEAPITSSQSSQTDDAVLPDLNPDKVCFIISKARELNAGEEVEDDDDASNQTDDDFSSALTGANDDPVRRELSGFMAALDVDEQQQLVALAWIGRGDFEKDEWTDAVAQAAERGDPPTLVYLLGMPLLADYLEEGLSLFDMSCDDMETNRL